MSVPAAEAPGSRARTLAELASWLHSTYGPRKPIDQRPPARALPHYFLHRRFGGEQDLLVILNTKRCSYRCHYCQLPEKSSPDWIPASDVIAQFRHVLLEMKHSLGTLTRLTLSNEGSVLDAETLDPAALEAIVDAVAELRRVREVVFETRLEYVEVDFLLGLRAGLPDVRQVLLTGFETQDERIRDEVLHKREPLSTFRSGLDRVAAVGADLSSYVLFKPDPSMTDADAYDEARRTIEFLRRECENRDIPLSVRINPMYAARGSRWAGHASKTPEYRPPRLPDVMRLAEETRADGLPVYIGLSTEGLADVDGTYMARGGGSAAPLIGPVLEFNEGARDSFADIEGILEA